MRHPMQPATPEVRIHTRDDEVLVITKWTPINEAEPYFEIVVFYGDQTPPENQDPKDNEHEPKDLLYITETQAKRLGAALIFDAALQ